MKGGRLVPIERGPEIEGGRSEADHRCLMRWTRVVTFNDIGRELNFE